MLLAIGIEMRARGLEIRSIALCRFMNVNSMLARREILRIQFDFYALRRRGNCCGTYCLTLSILQVYRYWL